jgi:hypothetical protein
MATGGFTGFDPTSRGSSSAGVNSIFLTQITAPPGGGTANAILFDMPSSASGTSYKALIYDSAHSALLATGSAITALNANYNRLPLVSSLALTGGANYYVGYVCTTAINVTLQVGSATSWFANGGQSVTTPANPLAAGVSSTNGLMIALELDGTTSQGFGFGPDNSSAITLSASNTIATSAVTVSQGARSILTHVTGDGKFYAEIVAGGTLNTFVAIGLNVAAWGTPQGATNRAYTYMLLPTGNRLDATSIGLTYVSGDVIGIAYDAINNFVWWNKNNGSWFGASSTPGNPATPSGGLAVQSTSWPMALSVATGATGIAAAFTLRDTAGALQYTPPSGFSAWSSATFPAVASAQARAMVLA